MVGEQTGMYVGWSTVIIWQIESVRAEWIVHRVTERAQKKVNVDTFRLLVQRKNNRVYGKFNMQSSSFAEKSSRSVLNSSFK